MSHTCYSETISLANGNVKLTRNYCQSGGYPQQ